jgi:hypothetical protein
MKKTFEAMPIVSLAMIAAINIAQVNISMRAKVPNTSLGLASITQSYFLGPYPTLLSRQASGLLGVF